MTWNRRFCLQLLAYVFLLNTTTIFVQAADREVPWTTSRIRGTPEPPARFKLQSAFTDLRFQRPTSVETIPDSNRLVVSEMGGKIFSFAKQSGVKSPDLLLDLREELPADIANKSVSLFDIELHPQFPRHPHLYACYVHPGNGGHTRVSRWTIETTQPPRASPNSEEVIITWPSGGHNGGCLEFGKDGMLYISTGDGSGPNPPDGLTTGQDVSDLLGAILRIDVAHPSGEQKYSIPADNPFVQTDGARPEIWSYGLRNPWKFGIDSQEGNIFAADNGWESWEMVHHITRGSNCGWPVMEGRVGLRSEVKPGPTPIIPPAKDHPHSEANSVIGGPVYRGTKLPDLAGSFIYGDYITGTIWGMKADSDGGWSTTTLVDTDQRIIAFTLGSAGELYVLDFDLTGQIYELVPSNQEDRSAQFPRKLSETGLFASLDTMQPSPGVVPYQVQAKRWMDGAQGERWIGIPGSGQVRWDASPSLPFPEGTVLVKHLTLPPVAQGKGPTRLETQVLHFEEGVWHPYSYLWDEAGRDAQLVPSIGASRQLRIDSGDSSKPVVERTWQVQAINECKLCHDAMAGSVLGFVPNQLRLSHNDRDQLEDLASQGIVGSTIPDSPEGRLVDPFEPRHSLNDRARSYLHANCSMCHQPAGNAIVSFYLRRDMPFEKLNTNKGTGIGTFGLRDAKIIAPGDPYRSILFYRMSKLGYARMPYIGSQLVDSAGVALIEDWIRSLDASNAQPRSGPLTSGSPEWNAIQTLLSKANPPADEETIHTLTKSTEGALALIGQLHHQEPSVLRHRSSVVKFAKTAPADVRGLLETFMPESERRKTLGSSINPDTILKTTGSRERGKLIFFSDNARCRNCHDLENREQSLGPTLQEIKKKYPRPAELLQHVLQPSLKIDEPFTSVSLTTDDGRAIAGLLVSKTDREIVVKTAEKQIVRVPVSEVLESRKSSQSLMPERLLSDLTVQEAADLLSYLSGE